VKAGVTAFFHDALAMEDITGSPTSGGCSMPIAAIPSPVPVPLPGTKTSDPVVSPDAFTIDCADCVHRQTPVCDDCVVSFIVGRQPNDAIVVDADEARAVRLLEQAGLVPGVRHSRQVG
jgi:hypothetical protein